MGDDTGRIAQPLTHAARRIVFGLPAVDELVLLTDVDRAHLVMLTEQQLIDRQESSAVLSEITRLRAGGFAPLRGREARRGLYLLYEDHLAGRLGPRIAGRLRTGRSRNDLNATLFLLRLRPAYQRLMASVLRLQAVLLRGAGRHRGLVMPAYTHYQAAFPTTLGHYLAGVSAAFDRDVEGLAGLAPHLGRCPLGAGAGGGTTVAVDVIRVADLLGFSSAVEHSTDAVASREPALRLLAAAAVAGVTMSRLAHDLLLWTTGEFGFLHLPDSLIGSSSVLPQKRNPFLLEHVKGRAAVAMGAFTTAATAMGATPFANSVAAGTEGCAPVVAALDASADAAHLLALVVAGARPDAVAMAERARAGHVVAAALAEHKAAVSGVSFREAHHDIGAAITASDLGLVAAADPADVVAAARFGAGPGSSPPLERSRSRWAGWVSEHRARARHWQHAAQRLDAAVDTVCSGRQSSAEASLTAPAPV